MIRFGSSPFYRNNKNLHKDGVVQEFTLEQVREIKKCREDIEYFAEKYFYIVNIDQGKIRIPLYDYQRDALHSIQDHRFNIFCQSRQSGKSTTLTVAILHFILFNEQKKVALLGNKASQSREILERIKLAYEMVPLWLKHGVKTWNKGSIQISNGCSIIAAATSSASIRGEAIAFLLIDEAAFVENWEKFYTSTYPTISSGQESKVVMVSTANGMNHFYKIWDGANRPKDDEEANEFIPTEVDWRAVPNRDEKWRKQTVANTSEEAFMQEHENIFLGSSNTLISLGALHNMVNKKPLYEKDGLKIYDHVQKDHTYALAADVGRGAKQDYSAFSVIDITTYPFKQVCTYRNNEISYMMYPDVIHRIATEYNNAWCIIENNDIGGHVVTELNHNLEYDNIVNESTVAYELGVRTTIRTKSVGCTNTKNLIEGTKLILQDFDTIAEFSTFESKGKSYEAAKGHNDDLAMGIVMFGFFISTTLFEDITGNNIKSDIFEDQIADMYESLLPEPMIYDGTNNEPEYFSEGGELWIGSDNEGF